MSRPSLALISTCLALAACVDEPDDGFETWAAESTSPSETSSMTDPQETDSGMTETETDTAETDGGDEPFDGLRFVAAASNSARIVAMNLDDPADVPSPDYLTTGEGMAGLFGPTPWGAQAIVHAGVVDQLRFDGNGAAELSPLSSQETAWIEELWFDDAGTNAIATGSEAPLTGPQLLLWMTYDEDGELLSTWDITPPLQQNGAIYVPDRSPDGTHAAVIIDAQADGIWEIYVLPLVPEPGVAEQIDQIDLTGISPILVPAFLSLHIDDQRIAYRREVNPNVWRPVAVPFDDLTASPINLIVGFEHTYSVVWSDDGNRMLFTKGGVSGYRELQLSDFDGAVSAGQAITLTEPGELALLDSQPPFDRAAPGHGFDAQGRIWYAHQIDPGLETVAITLAIVPYQSGLSDRVLLTDTPPGAVIGQIIWDPDTQLLGYRTDAGGQSWISYIDMSADQPVSVRIDQDFEYFANEPELNASFGWAVGRSRIAVAGVQGVSGLHVAEIGDPAGTTLEIELPSVNETFDTTIDHRPLVSPNGDQIIMWYGTPNGFRGLIHASADGSAPAEKVLMNLYQLWTGGFVPHEPGE